MQKLKPTNPAIKTVVLRNICKSVELAMQTLIDDSEAAEKYQSAEIDEYCYIIEARTELSKLLMKKIIEMQDQILHTAKHI